MKLVSLLVLLLSPVVLFAQKSRSWKPPRMLTWRESDRFSKTAFSERTKRAIAAAIVADTDSCSTEQMQKFRVRKVLMQGMPAFFVQGSAPCVSEATENYFTVLRPQGPKFIHLIETNTFADTFDWDTIGKHPDIVTFDGNGKDGMFHVFAYRAPKYKLIACYEYDHDKQGNIVELPCDPEDF